MFDHLEYFCDKCFCKIEIFGKILLKITIETKCVLFTTVFWIKSIKTRKKMCPVISSDFHILLNIVFIFNHPVQCDHKLSIKSFRALMSFHVQQSLSAFFTFIFSAIILVPLSTLLLSISI